MASCCGCARNTATEWHGASVRPRRWRARGLPLLGFLRLQAQHKSFRSIQAGAALTQGLHWTHRRRHGHGLALLHVRRGHLLLRETGRPRHRCRRWERQKQNNEAEPPNQQNSKRSWSHLAWHHQVHHGLSESCCTSRCCTKQGERNVRSYLSKQTPSSTTASPAATHAATSKHALGCSLGGWGLQEYHYDGTCKGHPAQSTGVLQASSLRFPAAWLPTGAVTAACAWMGMPGLLPFSALYHFAWALGIVMAVPLAAAPSCGATTIVRPPAPGPAGLPYMNVVLRVESLHIHKHEHKYALPSGFKFRPSWCERTLLIKD